MMNDVMFELPDKTITPQSIQREPEQVIYPLIRWIASVIGIMHYIKTDAGRCEAEQATENDDHPNGQWKEYYGTIKGNRKQ